MDEQNQCSLDWEPYVWRGALGGAIGTLVVLLVGAAYVWLSFGAGNLANPLIVGGVFGLVAGVIIGLAIGYIIFKITSRSGKQPNHALRIAIGAGCVLAYLLLRYLTNSGPSHPVFDLAYAAAVGGLAGLMARSKAPSDSTSVAVGRA